MTSGDTRRPAARTPFANMSGADAPADRMAGLSNEARAELHAASRHLLVGDGEAADRVLRGILATHPDHAETLRLFAIASQLRGRGNDAIAAIRHATGKYPNDALLQNTLGSLLRGTGDLNGAQGAFRRACELKPDLASAWLNLGTNLQMQSNVREAQAAFARAVECEPGYVMAHVSNGNALAALGRIDDAIAQFRAALAADPKAVLAWAGLAEIKTVPLAAEDIDALDRLVRDPTLADEPRAIAGFALGRGLEDQRRYADAFAAFEAANATMRRLMPWDASVHTQRTDAIAAAFETTPPAPDNSTLGADVIFVVSLPRAGSTLAEQILAAHPAVEGAGEINDLAMVIHEESVRRNAPFPQWIETASAADWARLGQTYLERTQRWRSARRVHVDKAVFNWPFVGAIAAMLPGARIVNCRRDALETGWSCYKQRFAHGQQVFSYDLADIGAYWVDYDRLMFIWHARHPGRLYDLVYEDLVAAPEAQIRRLLDFCGLPFAPSCLRAHQSDRVVRTSSAAQVRQPLRTDTARASNYGELLAPLRRALGL